MQCAECKKYRSGRKDREGTFYCTPCWDRYDSQQAKKQQQQAPPATKPTDAPKIGVAKKEQPPPAATSVLTPLSPDDAFDVFGAFLADVSGEEYRRVPNSTGSWIQEVLSTDPSQWGPQDAPILPTFAVPSTLPTTVQFCGNRSPRGVGGNFQKKSSTEKGVALLNNPQAVEDVLGYLYATTDEDLLHVLVRIMDEYTNCKTEEEARRLRPRLQAEAVEAFGTQQTKLVEALFQHAKPVMRSLLIDFLHIDVYAPGLGSQSVAGPSVYFKKGKKRRRFAKETASL
eukprot:PhF_6_TR9237/c0_g1_i1/m.14592